MTLPDIHGRRAVVRIAAGRRVAERSRVWVDAEQVEQMLHLGRHVGLHQDAADPEGLDARVDDLVQLFFLCRRGILLHEIPRRGVLHEPVGLFSDWDSLGILFFNIVRGQSEARATNRSNRSYDGLQGCP